MISRFKKGSYKWPVISIVILAAMGCMLLTNAQDFKLKDNNGIITEDSESVNAKDTSIQKKESVEPEDGKNVYTGSAKEKLVVIDPGHGGNDPGAVYSFGKTGSEKSAVQEKDLNLKVSLLLFDMLEKSGIKAEMTRKGDNYISLADRAEAANRLNASLFVSIHNEASQSREENGTSALFDPSMDYSKSYGITAPKAAQLIHQEMLNGLGATDAGVREINNLTVLKNTKMPSILVHVGYITNDSDRQKLMTEEYTEKAAKALHDGIIKVLNGIE